MREKQKHGDGDGLPKGFYYIGGSAAQGAATAGDPWDNSLPELQCFREVRQCPDNEPFVLRVRSRSASLRRAVAEVITPSPKYRERVRQQESRWGGGADFSNPSLLLRCIEFIIWSELGPLCWWFCFRSSGPILHAAPSCHRNRWHLVSPCCFYRQ